MTNTQAVELHPSLRIMSDCLDVGRIEGLLGVAHTGLRRRGETVSKRARLVALHDVWTYSFGHLPADPPGADLGLVAAFIRPRVCALRQLRQAEGCDVGLWLSYSTDWAEGGFDLDADLVGLLGEAELGLTVSVVSWGLMGEEDDVTPTSDERSTSQDDHDSPPQEGGEE